MSMDVLGDKQKFLEDLDSYMAKIGRPIGKSPVMGYKELDLHQFFCEVIAHGGFDEVMKKVGTWARIWKRMENFDPSVTDASFRLRKNYERCLLEYETKRFPELKADCLQTLQRLQQNVWAKHNNNYSGSSNNSGNTSPSLSPSLSYKRSPPVRRNKLTGNNSRISPRNSPKLSHNRSILITSLSPSSSSDALSSQSSSPVSSFNNNNNNNNNNISGGTFSPLGILRTPFTVGDLTIESFGHIIVQPSFVTCKHIFPVGFKSSRPFPSLKNPGQTTVYTSTITSISDNGTLKPEFIVTAADDSSNPIVGYSPSRVWKTILKKVYGDGTDTYSSKKIHLNGYSQYGLNHPLIKSLIRELPNAKEMLKLGNNGIHIGLGSSNHYINSSNKRKMMEDSGEEINPLTGSSKISRKANGMRDKSLSSSSSEDEYYNTDPNLKEEYDLNNSNNNNNNGLSLLNSKEEQDELEVAVKTLSSLKFAPEKVVASN